MSQFPGPNPRLGLIDPSSLRPSSLRDVAGGNQPIRPGLLSAPVIDQRDAQTAGDLNRLLSGAGAVAASVGRELAEDRADLAALQEGQGVRDTSLYLADIEGDIEGGRFDEALANARPSEVATTLLGAIVPENASEAMRRGFNRGLAPLARALAQRQATIRGQSVDRAATTIIGGALAGVQQGDSLDIGAISASLESLGLDPDRARAAVASQLVRAAESTGDGRFFQEAEKLAENNDALQPLLINARPAYEARRREQAARIETAAESDIDQMIFELQTGRAVHTEDDILASIDRAATQIEAQGGPAGTFRLRAISRASERFRSAQQSALSEARTQLIGSLMAEGRNPDVLEGVAIEGLSEPLSQRDIELARSEATRREFDRIDRDPAYSPEGRVAAKATWLTRTGTSYAPWKVPLSSDALAGVDAQGNVNPDAVGAYELWRSIADVQPRLAAAYTSPDNSVVFQAIDTLRESRGFTVEQAMRTIARSWEGSGSLDIDERAVSEAYDRRFSDGLLLGLGSDGVREQDPLVRGRALREIQAVAVANRALGFTAEQAADEAAKWWESQHMPLRGQWIRHADRHGLSEQDLRDADTRYRIGLAEKLGRAGIRAEPDDLVLMQVPGTSGFEYRLRSDMMTPLDHEDAFGVTTRDLASALESFRRRARSLEFQEVVFRAEGEQQRRAATTTTAMRMAASALGDSRGFAATLSAANFYGRMADRLAEAGTQAEQSGGPAAEAGSGEAISDEAMEDARFLVGRAQTQLGTRIADAAGGAL